jgi:hypothetical protein
MLVSICKKWLRRRTTTPAHAPSSTQLRIEALEDRLVPAVTFHGGPVIPHAELESVYWGRDWSQPANQTNQQQLDHFLKTIAPSSYLSMLGEYGVGEGTFGTTDVQTDGRSPAANATVQESSTRLYSLGIQDMLKVEIQSGRLPESNGSELYIVYLPPNVHSQFDQANSFLGHHNTFTMQFLHTIGAGLFHFSFYTADPVYYAVIPSPVGNLQGNALGGLTTFQQQTEITSHELAEGVTNPNLSGGWWDSDPTSATFRREIGDMVNQQLTSLAGYVVQREWSAWRGRGIAPLFDSSWLGTASSNPFFYYTYATTANGRTLYVGLGMDGQLYINWQLSPGDNGGWFVSA